jgi:hypothetical protein
MTFRCIALSLPLPSSLPPSPYQGWVDVAGVGEVAVDGGFLADFGQHGVGHVHRFVQLLHVEGAVVGEGGRERKEGKRMWLERFRY